jgi:heme exporter protein D
MSDFFAMHGYAAYIWTCYAVFFLVLLADALAPLRQRRRTMTELRGRLKREAAKRAAPGTGS